MNADTDKIKKLKQQREAITRKIRREESRQKEKERKDDTRRKILDGALIQTEAQTNQSIARLLEQLRREKLTKPHDRALFGLEPLTETPETKQRKPKAKPKTKTETKPANAQ